MTTEELQSKIEEFIDIAEKLPERYREKCFEVLLGHYLRGAMLPEKVVPKAPETPPVRKLIIPIDVRAFLGQYGVPEESIPKLFVIEGEEIRSTYILKTTVKVDAQIQMALLTALENALKPGGKFEFSMEVVRQRCKDHAVYDSANFKTYFKNNANLFKSLKDKEHVELSPDGKAQLAEAILEITK